MNNSDYTNLPIPIPKTWKKHAKKVLRFFKELGKLLFVTVLFFSFFIGSVIALKYAICKYDKKKECPIVPKGVYEK